MLSVEYYCIVNLKYNKQVEINFVKLQKNKNKIKEKIKKVHYSCNINGSVCVSVCI